jgi:DNA-binding response OmpR family regulator
MSATPEIREVLFPTFSTGSELQAIAAGIAPDEAVRVGLQDPNSAHLLNFPAYPLTIDLSRRDVSSQELVYKPTKIQFQFLSQLAVEAGTVLSRKELLESIWGLSDYTTNVTDQHNSLLRRAMVEALQITYPIRTVRGVGFIFDPTPRKSAQ